MSLATGASDERKLGRIQSRRDMRSLRLAHYLDRAELRAAPPKRDWSRLGHAPPWRVWQNDAIGNCTCAAIAHMFQAQAANTDRPLTLADEHVVDLYRRVGGYDPARPETDRGAEMLTTLIELRKVGIGGYRIGAFAALDPQSRDHLEIAVNLFGGVYVGADLPLAARKQTVWDVAATNQHSAAYDRNSWGSHAMALLGFDRTHVTFVTWGAIKIATVEWFRAYVSEAWALISPLWIDDGLCPSGFRLAELKADLADIDRVASGAV